MLAILKVIHLENVDVSIWGFINYVNFATLGLNLELNFDLNIYFIYSQKPLQSFYTIVDYPDNQRTFVSFST